MFDYCRLCAELKDPCEIVTSIGDAEQSMEQKLRSCCQWTTENTEQRLPHGVCSICLDKLDKCWLFSQSVQLAQQKLHEIFENEAEAETMPLKCDICSREFCTVVELDEHRQQQGCEGLIKVESNTLDCKPTVVDFSHPQCDVKIDTDEAAEYDLNVSGQFRIIANQQKHWSSDMIERTQTKKRVRITRKLREKNAPTNERSLNCQLCDKSYSRKDALKRHLIDHVQNSNGELRIEKTKNNFRIIQINVGKTIFMDRKLFECGECDRAFPRKSDVEMHRVEKHSIECPFECWICHKTYITSLSLKWHMRLHVPAANREDWICELCGKTFSYNTPHLLHMRMKHSNERPHKCESCGLGFKTAYHLKTHRKTHTESQFKCNQCEKAFRTKHSLKCHLELHTGKIAKPFVCDFCAIGFRRNTDLKDHRRIHTGEKPFVCEQCSSNFGARSSYYTHMRKVHGISMLARNKEKLAE